jgi:hypothetical protein
MTVRIALGVLPGEHGRLTAAAVDLLQRGALSLRLPLAGVSRQSGATFWPM